MLGVSEGNFGETHSVCLAGNNGENGVIGVVSLGEGDNMGESIAMEWERLHGK